MPKRPDKIKFDVVKPPANMFFAEGLGRKGSIYVGKLVEALNTDSVVQILSSDSYMLQQLRMAGKKLGVRLLYGESGDHLFVKPISQTADQKRLMLLLREPRTVNELMAAKLELHLINTLKEFASQGLAHIYKDKWVLTEQGLDAVAVKV